MFTKSKIRNIFIIALFSAIIFSCTDDTEENPVKPAYVNFSLYLNDPEFSELKIPSNYIFIRSGGASVVIYRNSIDEFTAYDRMCTVEASSDCLVSSDTTSIVVKCPCCNSKYILVDGSPLTNDGEAVHSLRPYKVTYEGGDYIYVSN